MGEKLKAGLLGTGALVGADVLSKGAVSSAIGSVKTAVTDAFSTYGPDIGNAIGTGLPYAASAAPFALAGYAGYKGIKKWNEEGLIKGAWDGITKGTLIYGGVGTAATAAGAGVLAPLSVPVLAGGLAMYGSKKIATKLIVPGIKGTYYGVKSIGKKLNPF